MSKPQTVNGHSGGISQLSRREQERNSLHFFRYGSRRVLTTLLLYGLIVEWLLPLEQLKVYTELYALSPLLGAVGLFLAVGLFVPPTWVALLLNGMITVGAVVVLFHPHYGSLDGSLSGFIHALRHDALGMIHGNFMLSGEIRTLLLISGVGMMAIAVQSLMWLRQLGLGLTVLTAVYLLLLYSFLGLDVFAGLMRTFAEGLLLSALVTVPRMERLTGYSDLFATESGQDGFGGWSIGWWSGAVWLAVLILAASIAAAWGWSGGMAVAPAPWAAHAERWGERYFSKIYGGTASSVTVAGEAMSETGLSVASGKTGYGTDDSRLGGPLTPDYTVLFTVESKQAGYLRGDSKSFYSGKGWEQEEHNWQKLSVTEGANSHAGVVAQTQTVTPVKPTAGYPLFTGGPDSTITALELKPAVKGDVGKYWRDADTGALYSPRDTDGVVTYTVETWLPTEADVLGAEGAGAATGTVADANSGAGAGVGGSGSVTLTHQQELAYTELPAGLPARVGELGAQIITDSGNSVGRYEQAQAIAEYLQTHYSYSLTDTRLPETGTDFVDDFLFQQKQGYCVHFASAMAVLLRTQGIPARYVKGFAPGEASFPSQGKYTVRASDAHAWVEVWFGGVGWVPFDPTPGFAVPNGGAALSGAASNAQASDGAALSVGAAGRAAPGGEAAGVRGFAGRLTAQLRAVAERGAAAAEHAALALGERGTSIAERGANALADAASGAMASPPWAKAACAAAVGAAGLAMATRRSRERFALESALRRYGSALKAGRRTAARSQFLQLADALWRELYKRCGVKPQHRTAREYAAALDLPPQTAPLVADFVRWDEEARFDAHAPGLPTQQQVAELIARLSYRE